MATPSSKPEYPPLLKVGLHRFTMDDLRVLCVGRFPLSSTRCQIMDNFEVVVEELNAKGVIGELWVDGSFLTEKIDVEDCDVVLRTRGEFYDQASQAQRDAIDWFNSNLRPSHKCDSYTFFEYDKNHPLHTHGVYMNAYWIKQWGFSRGNELKGIAVIGLPT